MAASRANCNGHNALHKAAIHGALAGEHRDSLSGVIKHGLLRNPSTTAGLYSQRP